MLIRALDEHADAALLVLSDAGTITRGEVRDRAEEIVARGGEAFRGRAIGIRGRPTFDNVAWLVASLRLEALAVVLPPSGTPGEARDLQLSGLVDPCSDCGRGIWRHQGPVEMRWVPCRAPTMSCSPAAPPESVIVDPGLLLFHGRSGRVEATRYAWSELLDQVRTAEPVQGARWLLTEPMSTYEGVHVVLQVVLGRGTVCVPFPDQPERQRAAAAAAGVTHVSGSPAFFRGALAAGTRAARGWSPRQIAVGGPRVPAGLLDDLRARFPSARLTSIRDLPAAMVRRESRW